MNEKRINRSSWYSLIVSFLSSVVVAVVAIFYAGYVDKQSNQKLCGMVVSVDDAFKEAPSTGPSGQKVAAAFKKLRADFEC